MTVENDLVERLHDQSWGPNVTDTLAQWSRDREAAADCIKRLMQERDMAIEANYRQVTCIQQCAAHLGPDSSGTIAGLPMAVKATVARAERAEAELARKTEAHWKDISTAPEGEIILVSDGETRWFATIPNPQLDEIEAWMETLVPGDPYRKKTPKWWMETGLPRTARSALEEKTDV